MTQTSGDEISVTNGALILPFFVVFSHRNMIALKYASLTDEEYSKFMFCDDDELSIRYAQQIHIFGIWSPTRPDYIIDRSIVDYMFINNFYLIFIFIFILYIQQRIS